MTESRPKKVLVVCTHNAVRSQMAEGFLRALAPDRFTTHSAGTDPTGVDPRTVQVMSETDIDLAHYTSKNVNEFVGQRFDVVITVCESARQHCPHFPGQVERIHWDLPDPADASGSDQEQLDFFRKLRDRIKGHVEQFLAAH